MTIAEADGDHLRGAAEETVLFEHPLPRGSFRITRGPRGYRFRHAYYGDFRVSADGSEVACAPNALVPWLWQRFLVAQPLPLAALLHGLEPLHASAVVVGGRAVVLLGTSGAGKTSVALHLAAHGAPFLTDDVAAIEPRGDGVAVHPGVRLANVAPAELGRLPGDSGRRARLGTVDGDVRVVVDDACADPVALGAVYVLRRTDSGDRVRIAPSTLDRAQILLGATFVPYVQDPARLVRQLDVVSRIAEIAPVLEVSVPPGADAASVAAAVRAAATT